jgi:glycosyltransferase involved in cell wall biosynthesis
MIAQVNYQPLVSVIMPVYNAGKYLRSATQSILDQSYPNLELIIVDDGSTDGCMESISDLVTDNRLRVFQQANQGKPTAMNYALKMAKGEYYAINDADDISHPQRFEKLVSHMEMNPDLAGVFSGYRFILDDKPIAPLGIAKGREACQRDIEAFRMPSHDPTGLYRMKLVRPFAYSEDLPIVEGYDYILRIGESMKLMVISDILYDYRIHRNSVTRRNPEVRRKLILETLTRACKRRGIDVEERFGEQFARKDPGFEDNNIAAHFMESVCWLRSNGAVYEAIVTGSTCARLSPKRFHYWKAMLFALMPQSVVTMLRKKGRSTRRS